MSSVSRRRPISMLEIVVWSTPDFAARSSCVIRFRRRASRSVKCVIRRKHSHMTHQCPAGNAVSRIISARIAQPVESYDVSGQARLYSGVVRQKENAGRRLWDGDRIREIREARGLSQAALSTAAGVSKSEISRHETNADVSNPTIDVLYRLAGALQVRVARLFEPVGSPIPRPGEDTGHAERRPEDSQFLDALLANLDAEAPAEDSIRGDILKAVAALNRALRRADDTGPSTVSAPKAGR